MSPRQLEYFLEIYNQKSIKKAAEKLIISPQAVSKTIKEIEEELGVKLFLRGKKFTRTNCWGGVLKKSCP